VAKVAASQRKHIFVINDTVAILELFRELLTGEGDRVTTDGFTVALDAMLDRVREELPDLIVLDFIILDERRGWQFLEALKLDRVTREIPVIVCTAAVQMVEELQTHRDTMGVSVVLKPFDIDTLLAEIGKKLSGEPAG